MTRPATVLLDVAAGAVAGAVATVPMSVLMLAAQRAGLVGQLPPGRITDRVLRATGRSPAGQPRGVLAALGHVGFGAVAGVPLAVAHRVLPPGVSRPVVGGGWALAVWASAYLGWVPALRMLPRADHDRPDRQVTMVLAHLLYGSVLGALLGRLRPRHHAVA